MTGSVAPAQGRAGSRRTRALRAAQLALAAALLVYLLRSGQLELAALPDVAERWPWWLAANLAFGASLAAITLRWQLLLRLQRVSLRLRDTASLTLIGLCVSQVTPGATGGDIAKAVALAAEQPERRGSALLSIAVDRGLGLFTLSACAALLALADLQTVRAQPALALFAAGAGAAALAAALALPALFALRRTPPLRRALAWLARRPWGADLRAALTAYSNEPARLAAPLAVSLCGHASMLLAHLCLAQALLGGEFDVSALLAVVPLLLLAGGVPVTPFGNAGVLEGIYAELLGYAGIEQGALLALLLRSLVWTWALLGAALLLLRRVGSERPALAAEPGKLG
jgi:uncharacterized membrane protein YbhN (UPF0104 family)